MDLLGISYGKMDREVFQGAMNEGRQFGLRQCESANRQTLTECLLTAAQVLVCAVRSRNDEKLNEMQRCFHWILACQASMTLAVVCGRLGGLSKETRFHPHAEIARPLQAHVRDSAQMDRCDLSDAGMKRVGLPGVMSLYDCFAAGKVPEVVSGMIEADAQRYNLPADGREVARLLGRAVWNAHAEEIGYGALVRHKAFQRVPTAAMSVLRVVIGSVISPTYRLYRGIRGGAQDARLRLVP